jgi:hypothetical protein
MSDIRFGDYVSIEQKRFGIENELYCHKVIGTSQSNTWVDVPVQCQPVEIRHDTMSDVVSCICCGVVERDVRKYRICDVTKISGHPIEDKLNARITALESALAAEREKHRFISVSDGLPEVKQDTLFNCVIQIPGSKPYVNTTTFWKDFRIFNIPYVTHWQPLPEPPQEEWG